jgi:hypothetical protein
MLLLVSCRLKTADMTDQEVLDLYTDYLVSSFGQVTSVGLSRALDNAVTHDRISDMLSRREFTQKDYWKAIRPLVRQIETPDGFIVIDDTIEEKPYSSENDIICWHYDHSSGKNVKGINILNFLYRPGAGMHDFSMPISYEIIEKTICYYDEIAKKHKRKSELSKHDLLRNRLRILHHMNRVQFQVVLWDTWYSSIENFTFVNDELKKTFISAIKSNRLVALTEQEVKEKRFIHISDLDWQKAGIYKVYLKGLKFPILLVRQVFTNKDGSTGELFIVTNDLSLTEEVIILSYKKRWGAEDLHRSEKQNVGLEKSPTKYEVTQKNHIFAVMLAWIKLNRLSISLQVTHYGLKIKLYVKAIQASMKELQQLRLAALQKEQNPESQIIPAIG